MTRVSAMVNSLAADMQQRFFSLLAEATLFDPKCNQKGFHNPAETDEASKSITAASALMFSRQANEPHAESTRLPTLSSEQHSVWGDFDGSNEELLGRTPDSKEWGSTQSSGNDDKRFMKLMDIMKRRLYIVANCAPAEKIFSKTWQIISERGTGWNPTKSDSLFSWMQTFPKIRTNVIAHALLAPVIACSFTPHSESKNISRYYILKNLPLAPLFKEMEVTLEFLKK